MLTEGKIFWDLGKQLPKDTWSKNWQSNECVISPIFRILNTCSLQIFFYPAGIGDSERPSFKLVRDSTEWTLNGTMRLMDNSCLVSFFSFSKDWQFGRGKSVFTYDLKYFRNIQHFRKYYYLDKLRYCLHWTVQYDPQPDFIDNAKNFFGWLVSYVPLCGQDTQSTQHRNFIDNDLQEQEEVSCFSFGTIIDFLWSRISYYALGWQ